MLSIGNVTKGCPGLAFELQCYITHKIKLGRVLNRPKTVGPNTTILEPLSPASTATFLAGSGRSSVCCRKSVMDWVGKAYARVLVCFAVSFME